MKTAKVFRNRRSQLVRLPKGFQFDAEEVFISRDGESVILSPRPKDWSAFLRSDLVTSREFMSNVVPLPFETVA